MQIRLSVGDRSAVATLADNPTTHDFTALLPVTLDMSDLSGWRNPAPCPGLWQHRGGGVQPRGGPDRLWAPGRALAVVYAVEGARRIPNPGLIPLSTVDSGPAW